MNAPNPKALFPRVMDALKSRNGFCRADILYAVIHGHTLDMENPRDIERLHDFLDDLDERETQSKGMISDGMITEGFALISWRRKTNVGLDEKSFVKAELPKDPRPPKKIRRKKSDAPVKETKDWIPGVAVVTADYFNRDELAEEFKANVSELFQSIETDLYENPSLSFLKNHLLVSAKPDANGGGTYVTLLLRDVK